MQKSSLWIRAGKSKCQLYRVRYLQKKERICSVNMDLSDAVLVPPLLSNELEKRQWDAWMSDRRDQLRQEHLQQFIEQGLDQVMLDVADALKLLAKNDPKGKSQENRQLAGKIWASWAEIYKTIGNNNAWGVSQKNALTRLRNSKG